MTTAAHSPVEGSDALQGGAAPSALLEYLPALYQNDPFVGRFLRIFEDIHLPLRDAIGLLPQYFDPRLAPGGLPAYLAAWTGAPVPDGVMRYGRGQLIRNALLLHRWRGTKRGLTLAIEWATGEHPTIVDATDGVALGGNVGAGARLGAVRPFEILVRFDCPRGAIDARVLEAIIQQHKPLHVAHVVRFADDPPPDREPPPASN